MFLMRKKNSFFTKIVLYFMLVLLVPVCAIIVLNIQSQSIIRKQILLSNQNTLNQTFSLMDTMVEDMRSTAQQVAFREELSQYVRLVQKGEKSIAYERYELCKILSAYTLDKYADLLVYFPQDGYMISGVNGMLPAERYYQIYFGENEEFEQEFLEHLDSRRGVPVLDVINPWGEDTYLCVSVRQPLERGLGDCLITVMVKVDYFYSFIGNENSGRGGTILLFDGNKELLLTGNKEKVSFNLEGYQGNSSLYEAAFGGETYIMQVHSSNALEGYYAYATPVDFFWEQLTGMRVFSVVSIAVCIVLGLVLVFASSRKTYEPLSNIVKKLNNSGDVQGNSSKIAEFQFLEEVFAAQNEEKRKLYSEVRDGRKGKKERFVISLLKGEALGNESEDDIFKTNGMILSSDLFLAVDIVLEKGYDNSDGIIAFAMANVFEEVLNKVGCAWVVDMYEGKHCALLNLAGSTTVEQVKEALKEGKDFLEQHFQLCMTIGLSAIHEGMLEIQKAYQEAVNAQAYRYILGKGRIILWNEVAERQFSYLDSGQAMLPVMLEDYLNQTEEMIDINGFVTEVFRRYGINDKVSLETVECFKFDMVNAVNRVALQNGVSIEDRQKNIQLLLKQETLTELKECVAHLLMLLQQKKAEQKYSRICEQAQIYIEENYQDSQLSVSSLCEELGVSVSYLARLYKKIYGSSIAQEITRFRLKKAKEQLQDADRSINEIAEENGFSSANTFIKVFKKWEGITPGRYRELL